MIELPEHYTSIDYLPMLNWDKINKQNDLTYLLIKPAKLNEEQVKELQKVWKAIYEEFISVFGFSEHFKDIVNLEIKIARLKLKRIIKNDNSLQNFIIANEKILAEVKSKNTVSNIFETKQIIEKKLGFRIPLAECSVREFYEYINSVKK